MAERPLMRWRGLQPQLKGLWKRETWGRGEGWDGRQEAETLPGPWEAGGACPRMRASGELPKPLSQLMALFNHTPCPEDYCLTDNFVCLTRFC